jgi:hypothetical protein
MEISAQAAGGSDNARRGGTRLMRVVQNVFSFIGI